MKRLLTAFAVISILILGCKKDAPAPIPPTAPIVTTAALTNVKIADSIATAGGAIVSDGGALIIKSGIVWSITNNNPSISDSIVASTTTTGAFTVNLRSLNLSNTYYIRAFATNSVGTTYGDVVSLGAGSDTSKVRFSYNGQQVAYGIITSPTTGKKWLDRNLGAVQVATSHDDYKAYGDLFQWGRPADGHQLINWTASNLGTAVNGTTTTLATSDIPGHTNFIIYPANSTTGDWRSDNNSNRWVTIPQGPCPTGWHVPTLSEWLAEASANVGGTATSSGMRDNVSAYNLLKLSVAGLREPDGAFVGVGKFNGYWSSSEENYSADFTVASAVYTGSRFQTTSNLKSYAYSVRCLKD